MEYTNNFRPIRFRGKRTDNNEWVYGSLLVDKAGKCRIYEYSNLRTETHSAYEVDGTTVGQFCNMLSSNGDDLYHGDIIKNTQADINIIHWFGSGWCYRNYHAESLPLDDHYNMFHSFNSQHDLIGNIWDSPELVEQYNNLRRPRP